MFPFVLFRGHMIFTVLADPFAVLEGVAPPPAATSAAAPNLVDLDDLYGAAAPSVTQLPQTQMPAQGQPGLGYGGQLPQVTDSLSQPAAVPQTQKPVSPQPKAAAAVVPGGPAPMAPRGNAAVEQQAGRKDPFADLFS